MQVHRQVGGLGVQEDRAQAAERIRKITATLSVKHKYRYAGRGRQVQGGWLGGWRRTEDRAQAAESIRRITVTLSVICKYRYAGRGQAGGGGVGGGQSPGC